MKKEELIRRLEHLRCDPTGVFLEELIEELKAEKPKVKAETERGFLLERSDGNERTFYSWAGDWTPHLQEAHLFKVLEYVMEKQAMFRLGCPGVEFLVTEAIRDKNGRIRRLP